MTPASKTVSDLLVLISFMVASPVMEGRDIAGRIEFGYLEVLLKDASLWPVPCFARKVTGHFMLRRLQQRLRPRARRASEWRLLSRPVALCRRETWRASDLRACRTAPR